MFRLVLVLGGACLVVAYPSTVGYLGAFAFVVVVVVAGLSLAFGAFPPSSQDTRAAREDANPVDVADGDWKPCRNPECRSPILRASRRSYCSDQCKRIVRNARWQANADEYDQGGDIPF